MSDQLFPADYRDIDDFLALAEAHIRGSMPAPGGGLVDQLERVRALRDKVARYADRLEPA